MGRINVTSWIFEGLSEPQQYLLNKPLELGFIRKLRKCKMAKNSWIFEKIEDMGGSRAQCFVHGKECTVPSCNMLFVSTSCKDLSKLSNKRYLKPVLSLETSSGGSADTFRLFVLIPWCTWSWYHILWEQWHSCWWARCSRQVHPVQHRYLSKRNGIQGLRRPMFHLQQQVVLSATKQAQVPFMFFLGGG